MRDAYNDMSEMMRSFGSDPVSLRLYSPLKTAEAAAVVAGTTTPIFAVDHN